MEVSWDDDIPFYREPKGPGKDERRVSGRGGERERGRGRKGQRKKKRKTKKRKKKKKKEEKNNTDKEAKMETHTQPTRVERGGSTAAADSGLEEILVCREYGEKGDG